MSDHDRLAGWDAAYVLGALSSAERHEFEEHLADCSRCRDAVAELSALPGLLGRLDRDRAFTLLDPATDVIPTLPADLVERIAARDARSRARNRGRRRGAIVAGIAVAAAVVATFAGIQLLTPSTAEAVAFEPLVTNPLTADAELTALGWGTRIDLDCSYAAGVAGGPWTYTMWVIGDDGSQEQVSSWNATSGSTVHLSAATAIPRDDIRAIEIRTADGEPLLSADPG